MKDFVTVKFERPKNCNECPFSGEYCNDHGERDVDFLRCNICLKPWSYYDFIYDDGPDRLESCPFNSNDSIDI